MLLESGGLIDIETEELDLGYHYPDFETFWNDLWASVFRLRLQVLEPGQLASLKDELRAAMAPAFEGKGLYRPNITILAKGRGQGETALFKELG